MERLTRPLDKKGIRLSLEADGWTVIELHTEATDRMDFLSYPQKGKNLLPDSATLAKSQTFAHPVQVTFVIEDGLSSAAVEAHALHLMRAYTKITRKQGVQFTPVLMMSEAHLDATEKAVEGWPINWAIVIRGERPLGNQQSLDVGMYFYDRVWGESLQFGGKLSAYRQSYDNLAQAVAEIMWREARRLPVPPFQIPLA